MANKINFQKELDKLLEQNQREARAGNCTDTNLY